MTTMTDKEMLQLADKACGISEEVRAILNSEFQGDGGYDPSTNNGDCFELAAKLGISIEHDSPIQVAYDEMGGEYKLGVHAWIVKDDLIEAKEIYGNDRCESARLAVLRVAAEIGKRL